MQLLGILMAGMWAVYTFYFQLELKDLSANLTPKIELQKVGKDGNSLAILAKLKLENRGQKELFLLKSYYIVFGSKTVVKRKSSNEFLKLLEKIFKNGRESNLSQGFESANFSLISSGLTFSDNSIRPNETLNRDLMFYVNKDKFDLIDFQLRIYAAQNTDDIYMTLEELGKFGPKPVIYRGQKPEFRDKTKKNKNSNKSQKLSFKNKEDEKFLKKEKGFIGFNTSSQLSLWKNKTLDGG